MQKLKISSSAQVVEALKSFRIDDIAIHTKDIKGSSVFFAFRGSNVDGNLYIEDAINAGAKLIVTDKIPNKNYNAEILLVEDARAILSHVIKCLYNKNPRYMVSVTGTNGKTSVVNYFWQICALLGKKSAAIGTIGVSCNDSDARDAMREAGEMLTIPDVITMGKILNIAKAHDIDYFAFESSSHGLDQKRNSSNVVAAALTNITHDHLDYHGTFKAYTHAKLTLFTDFLKGRAIISSDVEGFKYIISHIMQNNKDAEIVTIGKGCDLDILNISSDITKQDVSFNYNGKNYNFHTGIICNFQIVNILIACLLAESCDLDMGDIISVVPRLTAVSGRMERVTGIDSRFHIFVDYAHSPDALEKTLLELERLKIARGKLYVVFGCGGDRDKDKRSTMGLIANNIADIVVITDDNPRSEDPESIRDEISIAASKAIKIAGREEAIRATIAMLNDNDIMLIAGKGHEHYQIIGDKKIYCNDKEIVQEILCDHL